MQVMQHNAIRVQKLMQENFDSTDPAAFKDVALAFLYGGPHPLTQQLQHSTHLHDKDMEVDPAYEPNAEEMANAEEEIAEEEIAPEME